jgi:hypothetical protein
VNFLVGQSSTFTAASSNNNKDCKDIQFYTFEQDSYARRFSGNTITIGTSQDKYSVKIDYIRISNTIGYTNLKNVEANDPPGRVLLPGGETITITLRTGESLSTSGNYVTLYNHEVSDCQILSGHVQDKDKMALKIISIEQNYESKIVKLTVQVPDASEIDKHFTKLGVQFPINPEVKEYYVISNGVQVS